MNLNFQKLEDSRTEEAFAVLMKVGAHLNSIGRRQRISKTTFETYSLWQSEKANYVVTLDERIVGLVTCRWEQLEAWPEVAINRPGKMIRALATDPELQGAGIAKYAMKQLISLNSTSLLSRGGMPIYLDCVSDTLPDFYAKF